MKPYRFLPPALEEMTEAAQFYEAQDKGLGTSFLNDLQHLVDRLCDHPGSGQTVSGRFRHGLLRGFPFMLIYTVEPEGILIIAVAHQRRRPGYWMDRMRR